jgi:DNA-binding MarR family transcriptional regulator
LDLNKKQPVSKKKSYSKWFKAYRNIDLLEGQIFFRISFFLKKMNKEHRKIFKKYKITTSQYNTLFVINNFGEKGVSMHKIKEFLPIMNADVTRIVDNLVKKHYVIRNRENEDRRVVCIRTTESGEEIVRKIRLHLDQSHRNNFSSLNNDELETFNQLLQKLDNPV